jgi:hypothetical protein
MPSLPRLPYSLVSRLLGLVLLIAAGLKLFGLGAERVSHFPFLSSPRSQIALVELEFLLGLWLLTGLHARAAWLCALPAFCLLAAASLYQAANGESSCGCFGKFAVNPWYTFFGDLLAVVALFLCRPSLAAARLETSVVSPRPVRTRRFMAIGMALGCISLLGVSYGINRPSSAAFAFLRGESLTVDPKISDLGTGPRGDLRLIRLQIRNRTDRAIRIVGGTADCSCITTKDLPRTVLLGEVESVEVQVSFRGPSGSFERVFVLYTDDERQPRVFARVTGSLIEPIQ